MTDTQKVEALAGMIVLVGEGWTRQAAMGQAVLYVRDGVRDSRISDAVYAAIGLARDIGRL